METRPWVDLAIIGFLRRLISHRTSILRVRSGRWNSLMYVVSIATVFNDVAISAPTEDASCRGTIGVHEHLLHNLECRIGVSYVRRIHHEQFTAVVGTGPIVIN